MKKSISLMCFAFLSIISYAQDSIMAVSKNKYIQADLGIGVLNTNMSSINSHLKTLGYSPIRETYTTVSFSTSFFVNRFLFRGEASLILPGTVDQPNGMSTTFTGYTVSAGVGYAVVQRQRFRLYPYVALNAFATKLQFIDHAPLTNIGGATRNATINFSNAALDMGVQFERLIPVRNNKWDCPQNNRYMTVGTRIGYNWSPGTIKARYNGTVLNGAPTYNYQGPYIKVVVGVGTKIRELKWK